MRGARRGVRQLCGRSAGVHFMQGYRFGKPMSALDITARLGTQTVGAPARPAALAG